MAFEQLMAEATAKREKRDDKAKDAKDKHADKGKEKEQEKSERKQHHRHNPFGGHSSKQDEKGSHPIVVGDSPVPPYSEREPEKDSEKGWEREGARKN